MYPESLRLLLRGNISKLNDRFLLWVILVLGAGTGKTHSLQEACELLGWTQKDAYKWVSRNIKEALIK